MKWLQEAGSFVARMNDRMPELLLNYRHDVWRRPGRPSKTLLGVAETGLLKPNSWRLLLLLLLLSSSLVTGLFFLVLLLNQRWSPPLRLQDSHCITFRIMCDVPIYYYYYYAVGVLDPHAVWVYVYGTLLICVSRPCPTIFGKNVTKLLDTSTPYIPNSYSP
jgi:hypothetical protein